MVSRYVWSTAATVGTAALFSAPLYGAITAIFYNATCDLLQGHRAIPPLLKYTFAVLTVAAATKLTVGFSLPLFAACIGVSALVRTVLLNL